MSDNYYTEEEGNLMLDGEKVSNAYQLPTPTSWEVYVIESKKAKSAVRLVYDNIDDLNQLLKCIKKSKEKEKISVQINGIYK